jgi:hypothetical protein
MLARCTEHTEIEARVGSRTAQGFDASCPRELLDRAISKIEASPHAAKLGPWQELVDHHYELDGRPVRTRSTYDEGSLSIDVSTIHKVAHATETWRISGGHGASHVRVRRSEETPVEPPTIVPTAQVTRVTLQQRRSLIDGPWRYDFSLRWAGATLQEAETAQRDDAVAPSFAIELEYAQAGPCPAALLETMASKLTKLLRAATDDASLRLT